jgi:hypothetical protein
VFSVAKMFSFPFARLRVLSGKNFERRYQPL